MVDCSMETEDGAFIPVGLLSGPFGMGLDFLLIPVDLFASPYGLEKPMLVTGMVGALSHAQVCPRMGSESGRLTREAVSAA